VVQLQIGEVDLAGDLGLSGDVDTHLAAIRSSILVASVAAGIAAPVGPVSTEFRDLEVFSRSTVTVKEQGFIGRACIHPEQVRIVNGVFTPSDEEVQAARSLLARLDTALSEGAGVAIAEDGRMIDEASARSARRILALAESALSKEGE
jgi:citrate lyase subunit beta/citryl-CoA lyase